MNTQHTALKCHQVMVICFQRWSKILVTANLKVIVRWKQLWHNGWQHRTPTDINRELRSPPKILWILHNDTVNHRAKERNPKCMCCKHIMWPSWMLQKFIRYQYKSWKHTKLLYNTWQQTFLWGVLSIKYVKWMNNVEITPVYPLPFLSLKSLNPLCGNSSGPLPKMEWPLKYVHWPFW